MADIRLITILPPATPVQGATPAPTTGGGGLGLLATIPPGTILNGFIINRDAQGNPVLRTDTGDVVFASSFFLNIGSEVTIRIENRAGQNLARLIQVDGQPPEQAQGRSAFAGDPEVIIGEQSPRNTATASAADALAARAPGQILVSGVVAQPPTGTAPAVAALPAGTQLVLQLAGFTAPSAASTAQPPAATTPQPAATPAGNRATPALAAPVVAAPALANPSPQPALPGAYASYARSGPLPPATTSPTPAAPLPPLAPAALPASLPPVGTPVFATVLSNDAAGEALLQSSLGLVRLNPGVVLPVGSDVSFVLQEATLPPARAPLASAPASLPQLALEWQSLQQIASLITAHNAESPASAALPLPALLSPLPAQPAPMAAAAQLSAGLLFFVTALRGGEVRQWLGREATDWLRARGHEALLTRADAEFSLLARAFSEAPPQQWQPLFFPFLHGGELQQVRLFTRRERKEGGKGRADAGEDTRFIMEIHLSQLGDMQMDGFVRQRERAVEFDLIIRSLTAFTADMQRDILAIYTAAGELAGFHGSLQFQAVREFAVRPLEELGSHIMGDILA
jgi:hypothetical protein